MLEELLVDRSESDDVASSKRAHAGRTGQHGVVAPGSQRLFENRVACLSGHVPIALAKRSGIENKPTAAATTDRVSVPKSITVLSTKDSYDSQKARIVDYVQRLIVNQGVDSHDLLCAKEQNQLCSSSKCSKRTLNRRGEISY